jgi:IS5 family transposase
VRERRLDLRPKLNPQIEFNFQPSNLKLTNDYYAKYEAISKRLDETPGILRAVHEDLEPALRELARKKGRGAKYEYSSDTILRMSLCQVIEQCSLRQIIVRVDDSNYLRSFVRIYNGPMIDFSTFCKVRNRIRPETWKAAFALLTQEAVEEQQIDGRQLRLDTTAVETNIHWPTDSSLLWDTYRTLARTIEQVRGIDPGVVGHRRLLVRKAKRLAQKIARKALKKAGTGAGLKRLYTKLCGLVGNILHWSDEIATTLGPRISLGLYGPVEQATLQACLKALLHYGGLGDRVLDQARRRVLNNEKVPNQEKIFSIFEPHTELLIRGKADKPMEFGHMIQIQQVEGKFITDYEVFAKRPVDHELLEPALEQHKALFGAYPERVTADKGYYESREQLERLRESIEVVAIAKKGRRTEEETERERDPVFRHTQCFRAGVEGTISFLKRVLGLFRCYNKGWKHFAATVGATMLAHNLLILARC